MIYLFYGYLNLQLDSEKHQDFRVETLDSVYFS